jgi:HD superfamily phosphohydrolase
LQAPTTGSGHGKLKREHEIRDPVHNFIVLDRQERRLVDSEPFQRLRQIHQLALTYNLYPGASHKRFEHSLGVMHLALKVFDVVADVKNRHPDTEHIFPDEHHTSQWRSALALAALCHDLGHLPFSHAAEKQLLPKGHDHESLTLAIIDSEYLSHVWADGMTVDRTLVKKLAVGSKKMKQEQFSDFEAILSEIITGDAFGVDRMDYLLRDSLHLGVAYGKFDHEKLIASLRILPRSSREGGSREPALGIEFNGLHSAEALGLARYFMYEQVYFHHVRRVYDYHLIEFMKAHYGKSNYKLDVDFHMQQTDNEILSAMRRACKGPGMNGHLHAKAILERQHFRRVYEKNPTDETSISKALAKGAIAPKANQTDLSAGFFLYGAIKRKFPKGAVFFDSYNQSSNPTAFPVLMSDGRIEDAGSLSTVLRSLPLTNVTYIFAEPSIASEVAEYIGKHRSRLLEGKLQ